MTMRVLHVCSEIYPLLKTGGLADVAGALPVAQIAGGCDARVLVPGFPALRAGILEQETVAELEPMFGARSIRLVRGVLPGSAIAVYVIDAPDLYDRPGNPYADADNHAYPDNYRRFALLGWVAARMAEGLDPSWRPQVVHAHDWHAGLAPAYLKAAEQASGQRLASSVQTIHNLAYQGNFPAHVFEELRLPWHFFAVDGIEFHGHCSFLKAGLFYADKLTTVSPTYAREIQGPEQGFGLDGLLRSRAGDLVGILNGVDDTVWNPAADPLIPRPYAVGSLAGKRAGKTALQREAGLAVQNDAPLFCVVSRLTDQKGLHLVLDALPGIVARGGQIMLLGSGDAALEAGFQAAAAAQPQSVAVKIGYDEQLSHRLIGASDVILVPSRFEPCGLTQLYGLKYGTLPLVRRVGGLADTVVDCSLENLDEGLATGFVFDSFDAAGIDAAVRRAFALYKRKSNWKLVQERGMRQQFDWNAASAHYLALYHQIAS
ncbi:MULTISPECIES: glycogen synthase GlgA [unclassified Massilia]|uniref:glycogen synthase GlgA n=1 Tax=unclassified Massilia TaxID=2609279 RepID=UPI0017876195|nr:MULTISPECIES: glycogen synthase GlgA [unclassified Massilia]MBD8531030.1 glycogen synthase GlgA [Massilia sp. CFBP 13647]MBD8674730.1 glycogen synthase GlgA [Massilia sp. CFBP 13721]